jgi:hypothetical protein
MVDKEIHLQVWNPRATSDCGLGSKAERAGTREEASGACCTKI